METCKHCHGTGSAEQRATDRADVPARGTYERGLILAISCSACRGAGRIETRSDVNAMLRALRGQLTAERVS
jgi:DnaJ-class molecular chaperone